MSSAGKRPTQKAPVTFFFCDRRKCPNCNPKCHHTQDPAHALSLEGEFRKHIPTGSMWQCGISNEGTVIIDGKGSS